MPFPTISYPSPTNSNPAPDSEGFASAATNAYSAGLQHATALRYAAQQDQKQKQDAARQASLDDLKQRNEYAAETDKLRQAGATPTPQYDAAPINGVDATGRPTLRRDQSGVQLDPSLQADDPGHIMTDSHGSAYHYPTLEEREAAKGGPTFSASGEVGKQIESMGWQPGKPISAGTLHLMMEAEHLRQGGNTAEFFHTNDDDGTTHVYIQDKGNGTVREVGNFPGSGKGTADKADASQVLRDYVGPNDEPLLLNKKTGGADAVKVPEGSRRAMSPGQEAAQAARQIAHEDLQQRRGEAENDRQQKSRDDAQKMIDALQAKEQTQHGLRAAYGAALSAQPDSNGRISVIDPITRKEELLTPARRVVYQNELDKATKLAQAYHDAQQKLIARHGGDAGQIAPTQANPRKQYVRGETYGGKKYLGGDPNSAQSWQ